jgi:hypothetical protein
MGDKRVSIRTLPSGEKVRHYPADEAHPEGKMRLLADDSTSPLCVRLNEAIPDCLTRQAQQQAALQERIAVKQAAEKAAPAVPPEKTVC